MQLAVHAQHDATEQRDEAAVGVPAEALVAGQLDEAQQGLIVEAQVEDGVHHARHRELGAGANAHQQRVGRVAEALVGLCLDLGDSHEDVLPQACRQRLAGIEVVVAGFGGDGEAGRHRETGLGHLGEAGALAAEQIAHGAVAFSLTGAEGIDVSLVSDLGTGRSRHVQEDLRVWAGGHGLPQPRYLDP